MRIFQVEDSITENSLAAYEDKSRKQMQDTIGMLRGKQSTSVMLMLESLLTLTVNQSDVLKNIREKGVEKATDFDWLAQLRYYWNYDEVGKWCQVCGTRPQFQFEISTSQTRLTSCKYAWCRPTSDTEWNIWECIPGWWSPRKPKGASGKITIHHRHPSFRLTFFVIHRTMMIAIKHNLGAIVEGPSASGKTETCKDLAKAVAKKCIVFNCSERLDYKILGKFFKVTAETF